MSYELRFRYLSTEEQIVSVLRVGKNNLFGSVYSAISSPPSSTKVKQLRIRKAFFPLAINKNKVQDCH